jgi:hypothetical protein
MSLMALDLLFANSPNFKKYLPIIIIYIWKILAWLYHFIKRGGGGIAHFHGLVQHIYIYDHSLSWLGTTHIYMIGFRGINFIMYMCFRGINFIMYVF